MSASRLTALALGLAAAALLVAAYASYVAMSRAQPAAAPTNDSTKLEGELAAVRKELANVEQRLATAERNLLLVRFPNEEPDDVADSPSPSASASAETERDEQPVDPVLGLETTPEFVEFEIAEPGLDIRQSDDGSLSVRNSNPALANQIVTVKARGQDGRVYDLPITVPPPE